MARVSSPLHVCWPQRERRGTTLPNPTSVRFPAGVPLTLSPPASRSRDRQPPAQPEVSPPTARIGGRRQRPPRPAASYWHSSGQWRARHCPRCQAESARPGDLAGRVGRQSTLVFQTWRTQASGRRGTAQHGLGGPPEDSLSLKSLPPSEEDNHDAQILPSPVQGSEDNLEVVSLPQSEDYDGDGGDDDDDDDDDDAQVRPPFFVF
nr:uncharacterized protein LOC119618195 [Chlorocebus sabaeus]